MGLKLLVLLSCLVGIVSSVDLKHLGCLHNERESRATFTWTAGQLEDDVSPIECEIGCRSFWDARLAVVGLTENGTCVCGSDELDPQDLLPESEWESECSLKCADTSSSCGGSYAGISVYRPFNFTAVEGPMEFGMIDDKPPITTLGSSAEMTFSVGVAECNAFFCDLETRDEDGFLLNPPMKFVIDYGDGSQPSLWYTSGGPTSQNGDSTGSDEGSGDRSGSGSDDGSGSGFLEVILSGGGPIESVTEPSESEASTTANEYNHDVNIWSHEYTKPGSFLVTLFMHNEIDRSVRVSTLILEVTDPVAVRANDVRLVCPLRADPLTAFNCDITVTRGTDVDIRLRMEDDFIENRVDVNVNGIKLPDPWFQFSEAINMASLMKTDQGSLQVQRGMGIVITAVGNENARVASLNYVAIAQGGFVLDALVPRCQSGRVFCVHTLMCETHCSSTLSALNKSRECSQAHETFCSVEKTCTEQFQCPADVFEAAEGEAPEGYEGVELGRIDVRVTEELVSVIFSEVASEGVVLTPQALQQLPAHTMLAIRCDDTQDPCAAFATVKSMDPYKWAFYEGDGVYSRLLVNDLSAVRAATSILFTEERSVRLATDLFCDRITQKSLSIEVEGSDGSEVREASFKVSCSPDGIHFLDLSSAHPSNLMLRDPGRFLTWNLPPEGAVRTLSLNEDGSLTTLYDYRAAVTVPIDEEILFHIEVLPSSLLATRLGPSEQCLGLPYEGEMNFEVNLLSVGSAECSFPFNFEGSKYFGCTPLKDSQENFCAVQVNEETFEAQMLAVCSDLCPFQVPNLNESSYGFSLELRRTFRRGGREEEVSMVLQSLTNSSQQASITWNVLSAQPLVASDWNITYPSAFKQFEPFILELSIKASQRLATKPVLSLVNVDTNETLSFHTVDLERDLDSQILDCTRSPACVTQLELADVGVGSNVVSGCEGELMSVFGKTSIAISVPYMSNSKGRHTFAVHLSNGISDISVAPDKSTVMQTVQRLDARPEGLGEVVEVQLPLWSGEQTTVYREIRPPFNFEIGYFQSSGDNQQVKESELIQGMWFIPARMRPRLLLSVDDGTVERVEFVAVPRDPNVVNPTPCVIDFPSDMNNNDEGEQTFLFDQCDQLNEGVYDARFEVCNALDGCLPTQQPIVIEVLAESGPVSITDDGQSTDMNEQKTFFLSLKSFGITTCLSLDPGDNTDLVYWGQVSTCRIMDPSLEQLTMLSIDQEITWSHVYKDRGNYEVRVKAFDHRQESSDLLMVAVSNLPCPMPRLSVSNAHTSMDEFVPTVSIAKPVLAAVNVNINCSITHQAFWSAYPTSSPTQRVDLEAMEVRTRSTNLRIPPRQLQLGLYKLVYTVQFEMDDEDAADDPFTEAFTYVQVTRSDLVAVLIKGSVSRIRIGYDELLTLDAAERSYDPDDLATKDFDYTWYCRVVEPFEEDLEMESNAADPDKAYPLLKSKEQSLSIPGPSEPSLSFSSRGCFGSGPGQLRSKRGNLELNTASFVSYGMTYEVLLVLRSKDGRRTKAKIDVQVTRLSVPIIDIECVTACRPVPQGVLVNYNERIALRGACTKNCGQNEQYNWQIQLDNDQKLMEWFCETPPISLDTRPEDETEMPAGCQYIYGDGSTRRTDVSQLALSSLFFRAQKDRVKAFNMNLEVTSTTDDGPRRVETSGSSDLRLIVNKPPEGGACAIEIRDEQLNWKIAKTGKAAVDHFRIQCQGFKDPENLGITQYVFTLSEDVGETRVAHQLHAGIASEVELLLPPGHFQLQALVHDDLGGVAEVVIEEQLVIVVPDETEYNELNIQELMSAASAVNNEALLSQLSLVQSNMQKRACYLKAECKLANLFPFNEINVANMSDSQLEAYNTFVRDQSHATTESLVQLRDTMTFNTMEELVLGAGAIKKVVAASSSALHVANMLTREGRMAAVDVMANMTRAFDQLEALPTLQMLTSFTNEVAGTASAILRNVDHILSTGSIPLVDMDNVFELDYDTFIDGEPLPTDPWEAARKNALHVTRVESIEQAEQLINLVDAVSETVVRNLVGGEEIRTGSEEGVNIIIAKVSGDRLVGRDMDGDGERETPLIYEFDDSLSCVKLPVDFCPMSKSLKSEAEEELGHLTKGECSDHWGIVIKEWETVTRKNVESAQLNLSPVTKQLDVSVHYNLGDRVDLANIEANVELIIERMRENGKQHVEFPDEAITSVNVSSRLSTLRSLDLPPVIYHEFVINQTYSTLNLQLRPFDNVGNLVVLVAHDRLPLPGKCDFELVLSANQDELQPNVRLTDEGHMDWFLSVESIRNRTGRFFVGLASMSTDFDPSTLLCNDESDSPGSEFDLLDWQWIIEGYELRGYVGGGYFFNSTNNEWEGRGMTVYNSSNLLTTMGTSHLTSFATGFHVVQGGLNFDFIFPKASLEENNTALALLLSLLILTTLMLIVALVLDLVVQPSSIFMRDNEPRARYLYEILFETGSLPSHGCSADIQFVLTGSNEDTGVRSVDRGHHFRAMSTDSFVFGVHEPLGQLKHLRLWTHSNALSHRHAWFINGIKVVDLQTNQTAIFVADSWLALDRGKESDEAFFYASHPEENKAVPGDTADFRLRCGLKHHGEADHAWIAPLLKSKGHNRRFSRVQRVVALCTLIASIITASLLFFEINPERVARVDLEVLNLNFDWREIKMGAVVAALASLIVSSVVLCFRRATPLNTTTSRIDKAVHKAVREGRFDIGSYREKRRPRRALSSWLGTHLAKQYSLPSIFVLVGYLMSALIVASAACASTLLPDRLSNDDMRQWYRTCVSSLFFSILVFEPIKVLLLAMWRALFCSLDQMIAVDFGQVDETPATLYYQPGATLADAGAKRRRLPLDNAHRARLRNRKWSEYEMSGILRDLFAYIFSLSILVIICYGQRDDNAFAAKSALESAVVFGGLNCEIRDTDHPDYQLCNSNFVPTKSINLHQVRDANQFWIWFEHTLIRNVRAQRWYNGLAPYGWRGYLDDRAHRLLGFAQMRQVRQRLGTCKTAKAVREAIETCTGSGGVDTEDNNHWCVGWTPVTKPNCTRRSHYDYVSESDAQSGPVEAVIRSYGGGGYLFRLSGLISEIERDTELLKSESWIDNRTRAVIVEFSVYNAQVNLFAFVTCVAEFVGGGVQGSHRIDVFRLLPSQDVITFLVLSSAEVLFVLSTLFLAVNILLEYRRQNSFFSSFWNTVDVAMLALKVVAMALYVVRAIVAGQVARVVEISEGNDYVSLKMAADLDACYTNALAFTLFLATIKICKLLSFQTAFLQMAATLRLCFLGMASFIVEFGIVFVAFSSLFFFVLRRDLADFRDIVSTIENVMAMSIGKFNFGDIRRADELAAWLFFAFSVAVNVVLINMMLAIINMAFEEIKASREKYATKYDLPAFVTRTAAEMIGFRRARPIVTLFRGQHNDQYNNDHPDDIAKKDVGEELGKQTRSLLARLEIETRRRDTEMKSVEDKLRTDNDINIHGDNQEKQLVNAGFDALFLTPTKN